MDQVDLRSDTVTRPTPSMRRAMAEAEVGDDVYGEDPTVARLERHVAELLGKPRALFVPSGTMANQLAIRAQTEPGDQVLVGERAHCVWFESGAASALSGVQPRVLGRGGLFDVADVAEALQARAYYYPRNRLVACENTHNAAGGRVFPQSALLEIAKLAREEGLALHLDGARLWNASVASGLPLAELAAPFDTVSVCFSKGLGAPVGSALVGSEAVIQSAHRFRKMYGGGMRQAGVIAAGALYAVEHHLERLKEDHAGARALATALDGRGGARTTPQLVETNIVNVELAGDWADRVVASARDQGVLLHAMGSRSLRLVTHLDVSLADVTRAAGVLGATLERMAEAHS